MSLSARADVEADLLDDRERARLVDLAAAGEHLLVELEILLAAGLVLHAHRDRDLRGLRRAFAEHREFLEHDPQLRIGLHQLDLVGRARACRSRNCNRRTRPA